MRIVLVASRNLKNQSLECEKRLKSTLIEDTIMSRLTFKTRDYVVPTSMYYYYYLQFEEF